MIIFLIFVVLLVSGILLYKFGDDEITAVAVFEILSLFVGSLGFLITGCIILCSHVEATKQISKNQFEYEAIIAEVQAVNSDNEDVSKVLVIKDVNEWNKEVHRQKYLASSPWTSWCYSQKVVDKMGYIEVPEWNVPTPDSNK